MSLPSLAAFLALCAASLASAQQPIPATAPGSAAAADTPLGLSVVWRAAGRRIDRGSTGTAQNAFSPDGRWLAVYDARRVRVFDAASGRLAGELALDPSSVPPFALAVSSSGKVALGRLGNVEVLEAGREPVKHWCTGACGTLTSVAFSPDGRFLAYQGIRGLPDWRAGAGGLISVVDLKSGAPTQLEAIASIAQVTFSSDGRTLYAMNVSKLDDREAFGVRAWRTGDWRVAQSVLGSQRTMRRVAPIGGGKYAGVSMSDGGIEARDLTDDRVLWHVPLVAPEIAGASSAPTNLDLVEIAPTAKFIVSYEASTEYDATGLAKGTLVIRNAADGAVEALYDVPRIADISIAPDGKTFAYSTATGSSYTAVARVPF
jgi:hypothetical protein